MTTTQIATEAAEQIVPDLVLSGEYAALKLCTRQVAKECVESDVKKTAALILTAAAKMVRESKAFEALESGLDYARAVLSEHDASLGRTIARNTRQAEQYEADIVAIEKSLNSLRSISEGAKAE